ncbi:hypothetical protein UFOVP592_5 [uncultured Caudovirales phage]|uniref:Uncharacterized protein n=1 Tax=uncultured Caudovirales phage TaxID=2100421 RepID=A0A6J5N1W0_9CAUD|nr:hypothetical protein UFOVP592_5 [uncultured Caudovirales phage]
MSTIKPLSAEHRASIRHTLKTSPNKRKPKQIHTPEGVFDSVRAYALAKGLAPITIYKRIKLYPQQYYYQQK